MNTVKLQRFETCDYALTSQEGKLSIMGIFDRIFVQNLPAQHPTMCLVVVAQGVPKSDHKIKLVINSPSGQKINEFSMQVKTNESGYFNIIANVNNVPITQQGMLSIECYDGEEKIGTKTVMISKTPSLQTGTSKN